MLVKGSYLQELYSIIPWPSGLDWSSGQSPFPFRLCKDDQPFLIIRKMQKLFNESVFIHSSLNFIHFKVIQCLSRCVGFAIIWHGKEWTDRNLFCKQSTAVLINHSMSQAMVRPRHRALGYIALALLNREHDLKTWVQPKNKIEIKLVWFARLVQNRILERKDWDEKRKLCGF